MLTLKVRRLTAKEAKFLRRWDAKDDDELWMRLDGFSPVYARRFTCNRCGGKASEYIVEDDPGLWQWDCFCDDCTPPRDEDELFPAWTGWKVNGRHFVPLMRRTTPAEMTRLDIIVPENLCGEIVWRRGVAIFKTVMQATVPTPSDVLRLGRLQVKSTCLDQD